MAEISLSDEKDLQISEWMNQYGSSVRGYILGMVRRADIADDICQDVFIRAWQNLGSYQEQGEARAYLMKIAYRLVCNSRRRADREVCVDDQTWEGIQPEDGADNPYQSAARSDTAKALNKILDNLSPLEKRILLLRYYGQLKFNEISELIDIPINTVLSHAHRGLKKLRELMQDEKNHELLTNA